MWRRNIKYIWNLLDDKNVAWAKTDSLIPTVSLVIIGLLLLVVICVVIFIVQNIDQNNHFTTPTLNKEKLDIENKLQKWKVITN